MTMSEADGGIVASEADSINRSCDILGVDPVAARAIGIEMRNENDDQ